MTPHMCHVQGPSQPAPAAQPPAQQLPGASSSFAALLRTQPAQADEPARRPGSPAVESEQSATAMPLLPSLPAQPVPVAPGAALAPLPQLQDSLPPVTATSVDFSVAPPAESPCGTLAAAGAAAAGVFDDDGPAAPPSDLAALAAALRRQQQEMLRGLSQPAAAPAAPAPAPAPLAPAAQQPLPLPVPAPVSEPAWQPHTPAQHTPAQQEQLQWQEVPALPAQPHPLALPQQQPYLPPPPRQQPTAAPQDAEAEIDELLGLLGIG